MIDITQGGQAAEFLITPGVTLTETLGDVPRLGYALSLQQKTRPFTMGDPVTLSDHHGTRFSGFVTAARVGYHETTQRLLWVVQAVGEAARLRRVRCFPAKLYEDAACGAIFRDIVDTVLSGFGYTYSGVEDGPTLEAFRITEHDTAFDVLYRRLPQEAAVAGQRWFTRLGPDDDFLFAPISSLAASRIPLTDQDRPFKTDPSGFSLEISEREYYNAVLVTARDVSVGSVVEQQTREEQEAWFEFFFRALRVTAAAGQPTNTTLGQRGVDDLVAVGAGLVWERGSKLIEDLEPTAMSTDDKILNLTYEGAWAGRVVVADAEAIAEGDMQMGFLDLPSAASMQELVVAGRAFLINHGERRGTEALSVQLPVPPGPGAPTDYADVEVAQVIQDASLQADGFVLSGDYLIRSVTLQSHLAHLWATTIEAEAFFRSESPSDFLDTDLTRLPAGTKIDSNAPTTKILQQAEAAGVAHDFSISLV